MSEFQLCKKCVWPRQCRNYVKCGRTQALTNQLDRAMADNDEAEVAKIDLKLKALEDEQE